MITLHTAFHLTFLQQKYHVYVMCTTVNPLYSDIHYNSKIRYKFGLHKNQRIVYFFIDIPFLFFRKIYVLCIF